LKDGPDTPVELKVRALRYLTQREHSRAELERKLGPHAQSTAILQGVLGELEGRKLLSNHRFAESRTRVLARKYGAAKIRQDLKSKGVDDETIARLAPVDELERARAILARRYREPASSREEKARRARFLQSRGFSLDVVQALVLRAEVET
jgi:regulatory protein